MTARLGLLPTEESGRKCRQQNLKSGNSELVSSQKVGPKKCGRGNTGSSSYDSLFIYFILIAQSTIVILGAGTVAISHWFFILLSQSNLWSGLMRIPSQDEAIWLPTQDEAVLMYARFLRARHGAAASKLARKEGDVEGHKVWNAVADAVDQSPHWPQPRLLDERAA